MFSVLYAMLQNRSPDRLPSTFYSKADFRNLKGAEAFQQILGVIRRGFFATLPRAEAG